MPNLAVIGDEASVLAFKAVGAETFAVDKAQAQAALREILDKDFALLLITEDLQFVTQELLDDNPGQVYLYIPPIREATGDGNKQMEQIIQKTIGIKH